MHDVKVRVVTGNGSQHGAAEENPTNKTGSRRERKGKEPKPTWETPSQNSIKMSLTRLKEEE